MENEFMRRGYLLPPGCKDLGDALKLTHNPSPDAWVLGSSYLPPSKFDTAPEPSVGKEPLPVIKGQIFILPGTTVQRLTALLGQKPFQIIADLMKIGVFATLNSLLDFKTISKVARMHGFIAIRSM